MVMEKSGPWTATLFNSAFFLFVSLEDFPGSVDILQQAIRFADRPHGKGKQQMAQVVFVFLRDPRRLRGNPVIDFFIELLVDVHFELFGLVALLTPDAFDVIVDIRDFVIYFFPAMAAE